MQIESAPHDAFLAEIIGADDNDQIGPATSKILSDATAEFQRGLTLDLTPWGSHKVRIYGKAKPKKVRGDLIKPKNSLMVSPVQSDGRTYEEHRNVVTHMARELQEGRNPLSMEELAEHERNEAKPSPSYVDPPWPAERREAQDRGAIAELMRAILKITMEENQE